VDEWISENQRPKQILRFAQNDPCHWATLKAHQTWIWLSIVNGPILQSSIPLCFVRLRGVPV